MKYLVLVMRTPRFDKSLIDDHHCFLDKLRSQGKLEYTGPFTDKTGGAYLLRAENLEEAKDLAHQDPLYISKSSEFTIYEWDAKN